ncbi:hypothetical protein [Paenibacillus pedocola]|uniref:hypothetical protein n=1 Tax=Paenibacillus pedocola TaxID=3242193 RepID=UPI002877AF26|nr:hypothetical protein [Paenibacillus typhae]
MLAYSSGFTELTYENSLDINGGSKVNWGNIGAGIFGMVTIMSAVAAAPVAVPAAIVYIAGTVASGYLVGSSF